MAERIRLGPYGVLVIRSDRGKWHCQTERLQPGPPSLFTPQFLAEPAIRCEFSAR